MNEKSGPTNGTATSGGGEGDALPNILTYDTKRARSDMVMIRQAARGKWGVSDKAKRTAQARLLEIIRKDTVEVPGMNGPVQSEGTADNNAIAAVRTLAILNAQDQADDHQEVEAEREAQRLKLDAVKAIAGMNTSDKEALIRRAGMGSRLPCKTQSP